MTTLSESFLAHFKKMITSCTIKYIKSTRCSFRIYEYACFDVLKKSLTITN